MMDIKESRLAVQALLKNMADGYKATLKQAVFLRKVWSFLYSFVMKVAVIINLSSTDGGIGTIVRVIHCPVPSQYVNPDPNNEHEALLNLEMEQILTTDGVRRHQKYLSQASCRLLLT